MDSYQCLAGLMDACKPILEEAKNRGVFGDRKVSDDAHAYLTITHGELRKLRLAVKAAKEGGAQ